MPGKIHRHPAAQQLEKARGSPPATSSTAPPMTVAPDDTVEHADRIMYLRGVKRLPVVDADGHLAGIVSRADVLVVYGRPDAEIAEDVRTGILSTEEPAAWRVRRHGDGRRGHLGRAAATRKQGHQIVFRARHVRA